MDYLFEVYILILWTKLFFVLQDYHFLQLHYNFFFITDDTHQQQQRDLSRRAQV